MTVSSLDHDLSSILRPIADAGAVALVAPFANTLCFGFHYFLALGDAPSAQQKVSLLDWKVRGDLLPEDKLFIFYSTREKAEVFKNEPGAGYYDSIPVTRYRQLMVFLPRSPEVDEVTRKRGRRLSPELLDEFRARNLAIAVYSDILEQAEALLQRSGCQATDVRFVGKQWPTRPRNERILPLLVYGGPSTAYMESDPERYVSLEVSDEVVSQCPEYETHVIWHVPDGAPGIGELVRDSLLRYHGALFAAACEESSSPKFAAMALSCCDTLAALHPSFPVQTFREGGQFRACLHRHHAIPGNKPGGV